MGILKYINHILYLYPILLWRLYAENAIKNTPKAAKSKCLALYTTRIAFSACNASLPSPDSSNRASKLVLPAKIHANLKRHSMNGGAIPSFARNNSADAIFQKN
jgi:hypothetical protein